VRIRHYGLMAACNAKTKLLRARELIDPTAQPGISSQSETPTADPKTPWHELLRRLTGIDPSLCPRCGARTIPKPMTFLENLTSNDGIQTVNST
jgi:hypothetical protein